MTLAIETASMTAEAREEFIAWLEPLFKLSETPWDDGATMMFTLERRDGQEMSAVDGGNATLAAFGAGLNVLRVV